MQERKDTGRIYLMNVDHANDHSSFVKEDAPVRQSNLCCEITLPTKPLKDINDGAPVKKNIKMTKEDYQKYLIWRKNNPHTPLPNS
jgi:ribonucleotide reductase alpha subunit